MAPDDPTIPPDSVVDAVPIEDYTLLPAEPNVERYSGPRARNVWTSRISSDQSISRQFSLSHLFILMTAVSLMLVPVTWLPLSTFAGLLGIATLAGLAVISLWQLEALIVHVSWWCLFLIYITTGTLAILGW